jgi:3-oxoacyl-[acyl-carrier-protein] synthase III
MPSIERQLSKASIDMIVIATSSSIRVKPAARDVKAGAAVERGGMLSLFKIAPAR